MKKKYIYDSDFPFFVVVVVIFVSLFNFISRLLLRHDKNDNWCVIGEFVVSMKNKRTGNLEECAKRPWPALFGFDSDVAAVLAAAETAAEATTDGSLWCKWGRAAASTGDDELAGGGGWRYGGGLASGFGAGTALYGPDWLSASTIIEILFKLLSQKNGQEKVSNHKNELTSQPYKL